MKDLSKELPADWIRRYVTAYADDFHIGCQFRSAGEFEYVLITMRTLFHTLSSMDMLVNPSKSTALLAMTGTSFRAVKRRYVSRGPSGYSLKLPRRHENEADLWIPLHHQARYLGTIMTYKHVEDATLQHRQTLAKIGASRLQPWLSGRHTLTIRQRFLLWKQCVFPILVYGILAVDVTHKGLLSLHVTIMKMLRSIAGDHSFHTDNTHQQALHRAQLPTPGQLLHGAVDTLLESVTQRQQVLHQTDIVRLFSWKHLTALKNRIDSLEALDFLALELPAEVPSQVHRCQFCDFGTSDVAHFRRHCTIIHGVGTFRIQPADVCDYMLHGLPTCQFCLTKFSNWRNLRSHVERGCQALFAGSLAAPTAGQLHRHWRLRSRRTSMPSVEAILRGTAPIQAEDLQHLQQFEWCDRLLTLVADKVPERVKHESEVCGYLRERCILCGHYFSRTQELLAHLRQTHADYVPLLMERSIQNTNLHCRDTPCDFCGSLFRTHTCSVWVQLTLLILHNAGQHASGLDPPDPPLRCQICLETLDNAAELAQHMKVQHRLAGLTFNSARDCMMGTEQSPVCAHCSSVHVSLEGLRSHIVNGHCALFNPQACAEHLPIDQRVEEACLNGTLRQLLGDPRQKLHLTLYCIQCGRKYQRAADLAAHLQGCHSRLWRQSQTLTQALVTTIYATEGCKCNPSIGQKRANHVCIPFRQIAMAFHRLQQEPFAPFEIKEKDTSFLLPAVLEGNLRFRLEQILASRRFSDLWQDEVICGALSSTCLQCGAHHNAPELCLHLREVHICQHLLIMFYMEQLMPFMLAKFSDDFRCMMCKQIFNLPANLIPTMSVVERHKLAQSHLQCHCPCLLQISVLLASILHGGRLGYDRAGYGFTAGDLGHVQRPLGDAGSLTQSQSGPSPSQETQRASKNKRRRSGPAKSDTGTATAADADHGQAPSTSRTGDTVPSQNRHIYALLQQGGHRSSPLPHQGDPELGNRSWKPNPCRRCL